MKKKQTNWIAAALLTAAMFIATIYCILVYRDSVLIVGIASLLFLGSAFWLFLSIAGLITSSQPAKPSVGEEQRERMNYEGMKLQGEELIRLVNTLGKGTYINSKHSAERLDKLLAQYAKTQQANEQMLQTLIAEQTKAAKYQVKYNQSDTGKIIAALNSQCSRLNDSLSQCVTSIQNKSIQMPAPQDNSGISESLHALSLELERINSSIQALQLQLNAVPQPMPTAVTQIPAAEVQTAIPEPQMPVTESQTAVPELQMPVTEAPVQAEELEESAPVSSPVPEASTEAAAAILEEPESVIDTSSIISGDSNKQLSPDEIAALFAALG